MDAALVTALNAQANREMSASTSYLAAAFWFHDRNYDGIAAYLRKESESERVHALAFLDYLDTRSAAVDLSAPVAGQSSADWVKPQDVFASMLELERDFSVKISELMAQARQLNDYGAEVFLHAFVTEQETSVAQWEKNVDKMNAYAALPGLLWHLDAEMK